MYKKNFSKKILVILGHPNAQSFCGGLFDSYISGATQAGHEVRSIRLGDLMFDPILHKGYREVQVLEPDLEQARESIQWADHIVFVFPTWWSSFPALLKGFFDRVMLPGFGFRFKGNSFMQEKLLKGKTARLIVTIDAPAFIYRWYFGAPGVNIIKTGILKFCGFSPVRTTLIGRVRYLSETVRGKRIAQVRKLGRDGV